MLSDAEQAEIDRHRCTATHDRGRCQLMADHPTAHAATTAAGTRVRWDDTGARLEVEDYTLSGRLEQLRWAPSYPRVEA